MNAAARIAENVARVRAQIADAAQIAGRDPESVQMVAVTKYVGITEAAALLTAGCDLLGESRPQQLWEKAAAGELAAASWHLIGHLQRNKVDRTLPMVDLIHSVDSERLLTAINASAGLRKHPARALLEVNCSGESAKHGFTPDEVRQLVERLDRYHHVRVGGLMTMAAREGGLDVARRNFAALRELRDELALCCPPNAALKELSMGMSGNFEAAIAEGSTCVRIGSALYHGVNQQ